MSFLDEIVPELRREIATPGYLAGLPLAPVRAPPSLRAAIVSRERWAVMVEYKRRSPGAGEPDLPERSIPEFAELAARGGAAALSCLATGPRFAGSVRDVAALVSQTRLPVLFKDFVIDPVQVEAAHRSGASAVLLIARLETEGRIDHRLEELAERAHAVGLEVLLEFHAPEELKVAERVRADVFGVNLRDLDGLAFRPDVAEATVRVATSRRPLLGLSGVEGPAEARRWAGWGVDGILVGTGFARSADPIAFLGSLEEIRGSREPHA